MFDVAFTTKRGCCIVVPGHGMLYLYKDEYELAD